MHPLSRLLNPLGPIARVRNLGRRHDPCRNFHKSLPGDFNEQLPVRRSRREPGRQGLFLLRLGHPHRAAQSASQGERALQLDPIEKDLAAPKRIGVTHYRFSILWPRVEQRPGVYNEDAIRRLCRDGSRLKAAGIEPVVCLCISRFPPGSTTRKTWSIQLAASSGASALERLRRANGSRHRAVCHLLCAAERAKRADHHSLHRRRMATWNGPGIWTLLESRRCQQACSGMRLSGSKPSNRRPRS